MDGKKQENEMEIRSISSTAMGIRPTADMPAQPQQAQQSVPSPQVTVQTVNAVPQVSQTDAAATANRSADNRGPRQQNASADVMRRTAGSQSHVDGAQDAITRPDARQPETAPLDQAAREAQRENLQGAVDQISQHLRQNPGSLQFSVDEELGRVIVKIVDTETQDVIRQIPSEEAIALAKSLSKMTGMLLSTKA